MARLKIHRNYWADGGEQPRVTRIGQTCMIKLIEIGFSATYLRGNFLRGLGDCISL